MCLSVVYRGKRKKEALAKLPESGYYWKAVLLNETNQYTPTVYQHRCVFIAGWNLTNPVAADVDCGCTTYKAAFHLFRTKEAAKKWVDNYGWIYRSNIRYIRCKIEKKDIINIGEQDNELCVVTTRFWCPKPRKK
jgi:hypothetical protein